MHADGEKPRIGTCGKSLGVRVAPAKIQDITLNDDGTVSPKTGGMSVAPSVHALPDFLIPARLVSKFPRARGNDNLVCWKLGDGEFVDGPIADNLTFRPDPKSPSRHGFVEPSLKMTIDDYQRALGATQDQWLKAED
jgi:hypothetical protein